MFQARTSNKHRIKELGNIDESRLNRLEVMAIKPFDEPLQILRKEIANELSFSKEYMDFLKKIPSINLYDAAELVVEIGDIKRFKNRKHFISYAGLAPVIRDSSNKYYKIKKNINGRKVANKKTDPIDFCEGLNKTIMRCTVKLMHDDYRYNQLYKDYKNKYQYKHPKNNRKHLHLLALKRTAVVFAKEIYKEFKKVAEEEQ